MSATADELIEVRRAFGAWLLRQIAAHDMDRSAFIQRGEFEKSTVSRWVNGSSLPTPGALVEIARTLNIPPNVVLFQAAGLDAEAAAVAFPEINLPPRLTTGESRLIEQLAWSVRHWREEQNEARGQEGEGDLEAP